LAEPPRTYLRTLRIRSYRWWKPLLGLGVFSVSYVALVLVLFVVPSSLAVGLGATDADLEDQGSPLVFLLGNVSLAALIPCAMLTIWAVHGIRPGFLSSIRGRIRWSWLLACSGAAFVVVLAGLAVSFLIPVDPDAEMLDPTLAPLSTFIALAAVIVLTTPLQAAGEEYAFRGYIAQAISAWVRFPVVPIVITALLFAFAHGSQNLPLFLDRFVFGLVAGYLVVRTGGLEASIALHAIYNVAVLLVGAAYADFGDQLMSTDAPWSLVVFGVVQLAVFAIVVELLLRTGVGRRAVAPALTTHGRLERSPTGVPGPMAGGL